MRKVVLTTLIMILFSMPCMAQEPNFLSYGKWSIETFFGTMGYLYIDINGIAECEDENCNTRIYSDNSWMLDFIVICIFHYKSCDGVLLPLAGIGFGNCYYEGKLSVIYKKVRN